MRVDGAVQVVLDDGSDRQSKFLGGRVPHSRDAQHIPTEEETANLGAYERSAQRLAVIGDHARQSGEDGAAQQVA